MAWWEGGGDDDAAMLSELVALLADSDDTPSDDSPSDSVAPQPSTTRRQAMNSTARRKRELDRLRLEVAQLRSQLDGLRATATLHPYAHDRERASKERHKRRQAEKERDELHAALAHQTEFLHGLYEVFTMAPRLAVIPRHHHHTLLLELLRHVGLVGTRSETPARRATAVGTCRVPLGSISLVHVAAGVAVQ